MKRFGVAAFVILGCGLVLLRSRAQSTATRLSIESTANQQVRLSWPNDGGQLVLQRADSLQPPIVWQNSRNVPLIDNNRFSLTLDTSAREQYFRLTSTASATTLIRVSSTSPTDRER